MLAVYVSNLVEHHRIRSKAAKTDRSILLIHHMRLVIWMRVLATMRERRVSGHIDS